ncbi:MAG TPA: sensor histidine kinase, partial [Gammaproteobacteria bacterium]
RVDVELERDGKVARISVCDNGPGIPEPERERVFERFVRLETSRSAPGNGLGLSLVAAVAKLHRASLALEGNDGLKVSLCLPIAD